MAGVNPMMVAAVANGFQAIQKINAQESSATNEYQMRVNELNAQEAVDKRQQKEAYARNAAQQRARYASQGIIANEGSSAAVMEGLKSMSDADAEQRSRQIELARQRASLSYANATGADLLAKKSNLYQDNLSKILNWG